MSSANLTSALPVVLGHHEALPIREALSGIFGSISLACWLFLLLPQLLENYRNQSAEAISLGFIFIWFLGDLFNIIGSVWADLVPVVIAIGGYFCIADGVLISQVLYYGIKNRRSEGRSLLEAARETVADNTTEGEDAEDTEEQPLLKRTRTASITIPGSQAPNLGRRRRSTDVSTLRRRSSNAADDHLAKILEESNSQTGARLWLKNLISILAICAIGTVGWMLAYEGGAWTPSTNDSADGGEETIAKGAQVLGYASAALYLCARIPQIIKNYKEKSCEGKTRQDNTHSLLSLYPKIILTYHA